MCFHSDVAKVSLQSDLPSCEQTSTSKLAAYLVVPVNFKPRPPRLSPGLVCGARVLGAGTQAALNGRRPLACWVAGGATVEWNEVTRLWFCTVRKAEATLAAVTNAS